MFNRKSTSVVIERPTTDEVNQMALYAPAPETAMIVLPEPVASDNNNTPPMERSKAFILRLLSLSIAWGALSAVAWSYMPLLGVAGFLSFAALTALTFLLLYWFEYSHSPSGYQWRVLRSLVNLKRMEMKQEQKIRREALKAATKGGVVSSRGW